MTVKERAFELLGSLPEERLPDAVRLLQDLLSPSYTFADAPEDDEPMTDEERAAMTEGLEQWRRGEFVSHEEVLRPVGERRCPGR